MTDNTVKTTDKIEVYLNNICVYADEFIEKELDGDTDKVRESSAAMIFYIADRIPKPSHEDIKLLDSIFDVYVRLCAKYRILPTLEMFSFLIKTHRSVFTDWKNGAHRASTTAYSDTVKRWFDTCKSFVIDRLTNQYGTNANLIFVAKSAYGLRENSPVPVIETTEKRALSLDEFPTVEEIMAITHPEARSLEQIGVTK